ncbi:MAG: hypothetical protein F6K14_14385 [Symploca sp. SIO2C1]|nr:hypothetical protein [Symploca sp. SIO2C1]
MGIDFRNSLAKIQLSYLKVGWVERSETQLLSIGSLHIVLASSFVLPNLPDLRSRFVIYEIATHTTLQLKSAIALRWCRRQSHAI